MISYPAVKEMITWMAVLAQTSSKQGQQGTQNQDGQIITISMMATRLFGPVQLL